MLNKNDAYPALIDQLKFRPRRGYISSASERWGAVVDGVDSGACLLVEKAVCLTGSKIPLFIFVPSLLWTLHFFMVELRGC